MNCYLEDWMTGNIERIEELENWRLGPHSRVPPQGGPADIYRERERSIIIQFITYMTQCTMQHLQCSHLCSNVTY